MPRRKPISRMGKDMKALSVTIASNSGKLLAKVAAESGKQIAIETPVDTGRASGNWQHSRSVPILSESGRLYPQSSIADMKLLESTNVRASTSVFISNNVPYIDKLNHGWSDQAPNPFWIERAVQRMTRRFIGRFKLTEHNAVVVT